MLIIFDINSKTKKNQPHSNSFVPLLHSFVFKFRYESFYSRPKSYNHHSCSLSEPDLLLPVGVSWHTRWCYPSWSPLHGNVWVHCSSFLWLISKLSTSNDKLPLLLKSTITNVFCYLYHELRGFDPILHFMGT